MRIPFGYMQANYDYPLTGVEIGVRDGLNAMEILKLNIKMLYLIDAWMPYTELGVDKDASHQQFGVYENFVFLPNVKIINLYSDVASRLFDDNSLDFVYLDHNLSFIYEGIISWYPKLKNNGMIGGQAYHCEVAESVRRALPDYNIRTGKKSMEYPEEWYVIKEV